MFKELGKLCKYIAVMNNAGMEMLVEAAKDITCNKNYRKADQELTPEQFDRQVETVLNMANRSYAKECGYGKE